MFGFNRKKNDPYQNVPLRGKRKGDTPKPVSDKLADRVGTEVLDFDDRRRLAFAEMCMYAEDRPVYPKEMGEIVLRHVTGQDEVPEFADAVALRVAKFRARGY